MSAAEFRLVHVPFDLAEIAASLLELSGYPRDLETAKALRVVIGAQDARLPHPLLFCYAAESGTTYRYKIRSPTDVEVRTHTRDP